METTLRRGSFFACANKRLENEVQADFRRPAAARFEQHPSESRSRDGKVEMNDQERSTRSSSIDLVKSFSKGGKYGAP